MKVPPKRVTRGKKENRFNKHESGIDPCEPAEWLNADSVANPGDGGSDEHVGVELIVDVMNFDQQPVGVHLSGQL